MLGTLLTLPETSTLISETADISNPWFIALVPFAYFAIGIFLGFLILRWLIDFCKNYFDRGSLGHYARSDYASRHNLPRWYTSVNPDTNEEEWHYGRF